MPFAAGGPADVYARFLGQRLQDMLGQSFVVESDDYLDPGETDVEA